MQRADELFGVVRRRGVRLYKEEEEEEMRGGGVGAGDEFEGACKRRHGGGSDLNFYLLLAHSSPLSLSSLPCLRCVLPSLSTQPDEKRRRDAREREGEKGRNGVRVRERESARGSVFPPLFFCRVCLFCLSLAPGRLAFCTSPLPNYYRGVSLLGLPCQ